MAKRTSPRAPRAPQLQDGPQQGHQSSVATLDREPEQRNSSGLQTDDIARRAYEIYCERGCEHGRDMDDWLRAESELKQR